MLEEPFNTSNPTLCGECGRNFLAEAMMLSPLCCDFAAGLHGFMSPQVVALKDSPEYARVYQLLNIFASGRVSDFTAFVGTGDNKAWMEALGVDVPGSERTVRLLTLASLASTSNQISYATVAEPPQARAPSRLCGALIMCTLWRGC